MSASSKLKSFTVNTIYGISDYFAPSPIKCFKHVQQTHSFILEFYGFLFIRIIEVKHKEVGKEELVSVFLLDAFNILDLFSSLGYTQDTAAQLCDKRSPFANVDLLVTPPPQDKLIGLERKKMSRSKYCMD
ncbi:hypothetical protein PHYBLDRAFT_185434 [Phycomyces blakesleeanus NRRL 1555(-)]|uniref:Uncharacterized protein n=1 Tax=Phycomyces blakesleeanus (strain ATCC 8743b / DSM 1359 / FGSC 10004 / NBRC 33097 / NRRL 1555) TaxID=763407 RepID=A0A162PYW6_PHYB8|nr:hypothetical protein PHYBLDRAFT_185434 [Phycomyces blakesleeanus NRRL 1555(-)]OAD77267.1 hypothetical protein PHYBLDRAFT_185434 [Phycomyces blakesleeanus NRRL 1555(-)]|eukprot:XP_018295307.1 hypothetical protein PHYBLDRAFT_185434 [Phycomyces blakesleeanus NRRL 1555(-)]